MGIATPSTAYFMRMYLRTVRLNDIIEAARIDGCSELKIYNMIIVPSLKPALLLQLIMTFAANWNNTFYQAVVITDKRIKTLALYMRTLASNPGVGTNPVVYALLLLTIIPPIILYLFCSPGIMARIMIGGTKE